MPVFTKMLPMIDRHRDDENQAKIKRKTVWSQVKRHVGGSDKMSISSSSRSDISSPLNGVKRPSLFQSIRASQESSSTFVQSETPEGIHIIRATFDEQRATAIDDVMARRETREALVQELLAAHSASALFVRFLTAINEVLATSSSSEFRRKLKKTVTCFVAQRAQFRVELPRDIVTALTRGQSNGLTMARTYCMDILIADPNVSAFLEQLS